MIIIKGDIVMKITEETLISMITAFEEGMYSEKGISLDNRCCEDVYTALMELKVYRDMITAHKAKKQQVSA